MHTKGQRMLYTITTLYTLSREYGETYVTEPKLRGRPPGTQNEMEGSIASMG